MVAEQREPSELERVLSPAPCCLQDLPDVQELMAEVSAEKYSLQAAAILGEWVELVVGGGCGRV